MMHVMRKILLIGLILLSETSVSQGAIAFTCFEGLASSLQCLFNTICYDCRPPRPSGTVIYKDQLPCPFGRCNFFNCLFYSSCCCGGIGGVVICCIKQNKRDLPIEEEPAMESVIPLERLNTVNANGWTMLHCESFDRPIITFAKPIKKRREHLPMLLAAGADPNVRSEIGFFARDHDGKQSWKTAPDISDDEKAKEPGKYFRITPLHCAFIGSNSDSAIILIEYGADPDLPGCIISPRQWYDAAQRRQRTALSPAREHRESLPDYIRQGEAAAARRLIAIEKLLQEAFDRNRAIDDERIPIAVIHMIIIPFIQWTPEHKTPIMKDDNQGEDVPVDGLSALRISEKVATE